MSSPPSWSNELKQTTLSETSQCQGQDSNLADVYQVSEEPAFRVEKPRGFSTPYLSVPRIPVCSDDSGTLLSEV